MKRTKRDGGTAMLVQTISVLEAATLLGVGRCAAYRAIKTGQLPAVRLGRRLRVPKLALKKLLRGGFDQKGNDR